MPNSSGQMVKLKKVFAHLEVFLKVAPTSFCHGHHFSIFAYSKKFSFLLKRLKFLIFRRGSFQGKLHLKGDYQMLVFYH